MPTWDEFYVNNKDNLHITQVECDSEEGFEVCNNYVTHCPTLVLFKADSDLYYDYNNGDRTMEALEDFVYGGWENAGAFFDETQGPANAKGRKIRAS